MSNKKNKVVIAGLIMIIVTLAGAGAYSVYSLNDDSFDLSNREVRLVVTGSMDGEKQDYKISTIPVDSLIMIKLLDENEHCDIRVGDVLAFERGNKIIVHRVIEIDDLGNGDYRFLTKGDANATSDGYIYQEAIKGVVIGVSPFSGKLVSLAKEWFVWGLVLIGLAAVIIYSVREIILIYAGDKKDGGKS